MQGRNLETWSHAIRELLGSRMCEQCSLLVNGIDIIATGIRRLQSPNKTDSIPLCHIVFCCSICGHVN
jgi:hypothetical protein